MVLNLRTFTDTLLAVLRAVLTVGDAEAEGLEAPYAVLYSIPGGEFTGTLADPTQDSELIYQVSGVGDTREQSQWVADKAMILLDGFPVANRKVLRVHPDGGPGTFRDDDATPPVFVTPVRFSISSTPS